MGDGRIFDWARSRPSVSLVFSARSGRVAARSADRRPCRAGIRRGRGTGSRWRRRPTGTSQAAATLRARTWNADTVRHLARWANGDLGGRQPRRDRTAADELGRPVSLSVSGAVSLGSYQAGFLYYLLAALKAERNWASASSSRLPRDGCRPSRARLSA